MIKYEKLKIALRYYLLGRGYYTAVEALEYAAGYHTGFRKDGVTPEFQHQIEIAHFVRTLESSLIYPEATLAGALLHDVTEDYGVKHQVICHLFGNQIGDTVELLDKNGKTPDAYYDRIARHPIASIDKYADRIHNMGSMVGVFKQQKQIAYATEVRDKFLPALKISRRMFSRQEPAYENIKHVFLTQLKLLDALNGDGNEQGNA